MNEYFAFGFLATLNEVVKAISWNDNAVMWLETALDHFLSDDEREKGLRFELYKAGEPFDHWPHGRIFDDTAELKWEKEGNQFHVVYCGHLNPPANLQQYASEPATCHDSSYYLWGSRVKKEDLEEMGILTIKPDESVFAELRIPRLLRYPVSANAQRVKLKVREFYNAEGALIFTRFLGLEEEI